MSELEFLADKIKQQCEEICKAIEETNSILRQSKKELEQEIIKLNK
jgi:flagellar motility protein MotE (MotC chaperone)